MGDWKISEFGSRVTCVMMIHAKYQSGNTMMAAQWSVNTVMAARCNMDCRNLDYNAMVIWKEYSKHSDCIHMLQFIQQLQTES